MGGKKYPASYEHKIWGSKNEQIVEHTVGGGMVGEARALIGPGQKGLSVRLSRPSGKQINPGSTSQKVAAFLFSSIAYSIDLSQR